MFCAFVFDQCLPAYPVASLLAVAFIKYMVIDLPLLALSSLRSSLLATFRTFLDLIIIGGLIFFTGGFFSPFILILVFELSIFILYYPKVNALIIAVGMFLVICGISLANTFSSASLIVPSLALSAGIFLVASLATSYGLSYLVSSILKKAGTDRPLFQRNRRPSDNDGKRTAPAAGYHKQVRQRHTKRGDRPHDRRP
ncbi:MAG: hypothetical protein KKH83_04995 [Candidatus Margulisbacteria bacterium]|nr:hypothetical protein [Candidatus Margulisiibacteriota bacterium]